MHEVFKKHIAGNQNRKKMINFLQQDSSREYLNLENSFTWVPPKKWVSQKIKKKVTKIIRWREKMFAIWLKDQIATI